jgi:hypothetical protein
VQIDLMAPGLRFALTQPSGTREVRRETTVEFLRRQRAQVAINAHFFLPFPSTDTDAWVIGFAASEGRVFLAFETPEQSYCACGRAPRDQHRSPESRVVCPSQSRDATGTRVREPAELWTALAGAAQIVTDGVVTIPVYKDAQHPDGQLTPGGPRDYSNAMSWYDVVTARSAIGLSRDGKTLTLFTVDAGGGSNGMRVGEVAAMLVKDYGVWNALNLDGGGSTSLAIADPLSGDASLVNTSSDNPAGVRWRRRWRYSRSAPLRRRPCQRRCSRHRRSPESQKLGGFNHERIADRQGAHGRDTQFRAGPIKPRDVHPGRFIPGPPADAVVAAIVFVNSARLRLRDRAHARRHR